MTHFRVPRPDLLPPLNVSHPDHISSQWRDSLPTTIDLRQFDPYPVPTTNPFSHHLDNAASFVFAYDALMALGMWKHSGDWDWYAGILTRDGVWHGDDTLVRPDAWEDDTTDDIYCDSIRLPFGPTDIGDADDLGDIPFTLEMFGSHDPHPEITIPLRDIAIIEINER